MTFSSFGGENQIWDGLDKELGIPTLLNVPGAELVPGPAYRKTGVASIP